MRRNQACHPFCYYAGLGGKLTAQEVSVISGAIDLKYKTAISAMTPMSKVGQAESYVIDCSLRYVAAVAAVAAAVVVSCAPEGATQ